MAHFGEWQYTCDRAATVDAYRRAVAGWYHFVGTLEVTGDFAAVEFGDGFWSHMCKAGSPRIEALEGQPVVQLEFHTERVPWVLAEPESE